jgi:hypothetical protein
MKTKYTQKWLSLILNVRYELSLIQKKKRKFVGLYGSVPQNYVKQDSQCVHKVTLIRRVRVTVVAVEKKRVLQFWVCVCRLNYTERRVCVVLYCHLWTFRFYCIFSTLSHTRCGFEKALLNMCVLIFSRIMTETFLIIRGTERDMIKM